MPSEKTERIDLMRNAMGIAKRLLIVTVFIIMLLYYPHVLKMATVSKDKTYGYTLENPIKVGGVLEGKGPLNERLFMDSLIGPDGKDIRYKRLGSCCYFNTPNGFVGIGLFDEYQINYKGLKEPVFLFLNMYDYEEPKAPYGFTIRKQRYLIYLEAK